MILFLPYNDTSRPIIVPQEYLIHFDDFLLLCSFPTIIVKLLTVIKHLVSAPLNDKEKSNQTALSKQAYSYNKQLFSSAQVIAFMVKAEAARSDTQYTTPDQYISKQPTITIGKLKTVLASRTLRDITYKLDPYKKNPADFLLTTLTHILDSNATITLSRYYSLWILTLWILTNHRIIQSNSNNTQKVKSNISLF